MEKLTIGTADGERHLESSGGVVKCSVDRTRLVRWQTLGPLNKS